MFCTNITLKVKNSYLMIEKYLCQFYYIWTNNYIMKKFSLLPLLVVFIFSLISYENLQGQSLELIGDSYVSGNPGIPIASHIIVKNTTSASIDVRCQKLKFFWCISSLLYASKMPKINKMRTQNLVLQM